MNVPVWVWVATLVAVAVLLTVDLIIVGRRPHEPSVKESSLWVIFYVGLAALFGGGVWLTAGPEYSGQFFAGWVTEYSLSVDNLFVFLIIMSSFAVPRVYQQKVLMIGIITALVLRGIFIAVGAALVARFVWVFFIFGAFLIYTGFKLVRGGDEDDDYNENAIIRWSRKIMPVTKEYDGGKLFAHVNGRRMATPMLIVMVAIGTTDLMFAVDSIPAIFGLTQEGYLVFTANVFALMGLRQLYFLLGGLLDRLVYLSYGLAAVLGFIGVKLVLHALHENNLPFINGGRPVEWAPDIPTLASLLVIVGILLIATVLSLIKSASTRRATGVSTAGGGTDPVAPTESSTTTAPHEVGRKR
ncbi:tellurite resistance protein TerC [Stackebrandtia endophytica]|uniref:Tellurite resistance protein TerC n=1 Tax=Stackebrandtia endophytica TaxID=1496996 RepID=A0A543B409_9ACTN|nr:TerC family protein [Stackebrandtia endophytica]TQL79565.1 tellurite resistance protein TerC [Stackebrandtia endophytica]